jgi:hypothetical protein
MKKNNFNLFEKLLMLIFFGYISYIFILAIINTICDCI